MVLGTRQKAELSRARLAIRRAYKHRLITLLALEVFVIFALAPLIDLGVLPHTALGVTFTMILVAGMLMLDLRSWTGRLLILLGVTLIPVQVWRYVRPGELVLVIHPLGLIAFLLVLSWALASEVFRSERIKVDEVLGGVVLYLNIGLTFALAYTLIENMVPGAFLLPPPLPSYPLHPAYFSYFSFVTLTTVGYGDITPVEAIARSLATLEAALCQLYPAIILARLVSIEVSQRDQKLRSKHREQMPQDGGRAAGDR
jgi:Ion channel